MALNMLKYGFTMVKTMLILMVRSGKTLVLLGAFFTFCIVPCEIGSASDAMIGEVSDLRGAVFIYRGNERLPAQIGTWLQKGDTLKTGSDGSVGVYFNDETTLSLGPESRMTILAYLFEPKRSNFAFMVKLCKGSAAYVSGLIAKLSPDSARFVTPSATIGIRGTRMAIQVD
jgi:hypothetical protein